MLLGALPVTSCTYERSFSVLKEINDASRSTIGQDRLTDLSLLYIHKDIVPSVDKVIDIFDCENRRLDLH